MKTVVFWVAVLLLISEASATLNWPDPTQLDSTQLPVRVDQVGMATQFAWFDMVSLGQLWLAQCEHDHNTTWLTSLLSQSGSSITWHVPSWNVKLVALEPNTCVQLTLPAAGSQCSVKPSLNPGWVCTSLIKLTRQSCLLISLNCSAKLGVGWLQCGLGVRVSLNHFTILACVLVWFASICWQQSDHHKGFLWKTCPRCSKVWFSNDDFFQRICHLWKSENLTKKKEGYWRSLQQVPMSLRL